MSKTIQVRNVPDDPHRNLKARAAMERMSFSGYLLRLAERPTLEEMRARLRSLPPVNPATPPADAIRAQRDSGDRRG